MSKLNSEFKVQIKCSQGSFSKFLSRVNHSLLVTSKALGLYLSRAPQICKAAGYDWHNGGALRIGPEDSFPTTQPGQGPRGSDFRRPAPPGQSRRGPSTRQRVGCLRALRGSFVPRITGLPLALSASHAQCAILSTASLVYFFKLEYSFALSCCVSFCWTA